MLLKDNNLPFKISKHCMFTFNYHDTIYISGAHREDLKVQPLYEINYNKHKQHQMLPLKRLPDIPYPVLSPSMLFADNKVYIIGGYEIKSNVYKEITNRCFCLNLKTKLWYVSELTILGRNWQTSRLVFTAGRPCTVMCRS